MANRKTVNGLRLVKPVDDKTRMDIVRKGDLEKQVDYLIKNSLLDVKHYDTVNRVLKRNNNLAKAISLYGTPLWLFLLEVALCSIWYKYL